MGGAVLRAVVLSPVGTLPAYRGRGLAEQVLRHGLELARAKGYAISTVLGHPEYYPRVGYVDVSEAREDHAKGVPASLSADAGYESTGERVLVRSVRSSDSESLVAVYEREMSHHLFYPVRTAEWYRRELAVMADSASRREGHHFTNPSDLVVFEREGEFIGYAYLGEQSEALKMQECFLTADQWADPVYHTLEGIARERGKQSLAMSCPAVTSIGVWLKMQGAEEKVIAPSAWMMQVLDWNAWFHAFTARHPLPHLTGKRLTITAEPNHLSVQFGTHHADCTLTTETLTLLALGVHSVQELRIAGRLPVTDEAAALLTMVFSKRAAFFNIGDALF